VPEQGGHARCHRSREHIRGSTSWNRHDYPHRLDGIALCCSRKRRQRSSACNCYGAKKSHPRVHAFPWRPVCGLFPPPSHSGIRRSAGIPMSSRDESVNEPMAPEARTA